MRSQFSYGGSRFPVPRHHHAVLYASAVGQLLKSPQVHPEPRARLKVSEIIDDYPGAFFVFGYFLVQNLLSEAGLAQSMSGGSIDYRLNPMWGQETRVTDTEQSTATPPSGSGRTPEAP